jgi:hypothetical protein
MVQPTVGESQHCWPICRWVGGGVSAASIRRICSASSVPTRALFLWSKLIVGGSGWVRGAVRGVRDAIARGSGGGERARGGERGGANDSQV